MNGRQTEHNEVLLQLLRCEGRTDVKHLNGLNTYDYGARQYDGAKIVWDRMDPLCEKYYNINPYVYCAGNPVNRIDPDGKKVWLFATKLPGIHVPGATHTFLVVTGENGVEPFINGNYSGKNYLLPGTKDFEYETTFWLH